MATDKVWTKEEIKENLKNNDAWVIRALLRLYELQTRDEQESGTTHRLNYQGFNGCDAEILTSFVRFYNQKGFLSSKQLEIARKKVVKYSGQLAKIANSSL